MARGRELLLRDELLHCLQMHGKQCALEMARRLGRNEKLVMRNLASLADAGIFGGLECHAGGDSGGL